MFDFNDKVAIVTGAASGLGEAISRELAASGARLVLADLDIDRVHALAAQIDDGRAFPLRTDVANAADVEAMVAFAVKTFGRLDLAVNNAGVGGASAPAGEYDLAEWRRVLSVDMDGVFYGMRYQISRDARLGRRGDRQHELDLRHARPARHHRLRGCQARRGRHDPDRSRRLCPQGHSHQRGGASGHRYAADPGAGGANRRPR